jgi:hypothetical protein
MSSEEDYWEGEFPPEDPSDEPVYVSGVYPTLKRERQALQNISKAAKKDPMIAMKESQENLVRLCVRQIGDESVNYGDLRGSKLEEYLDAHQLYMLTELFDTWQTPQQSRVEGFLDSVRTKSRTSSTKTIRSSSVEDSPDF